MFLGSKEVKWFLFPFAIICLNSFFSFANICSADDFETISTPRFTLHMQSDRHHSIAEQPVYHNLAEHSIDVLNDTFSELTRVLNVNPTQKVVLRFLTQKEFKQLTGAPAWTNAMFFRGEITIPLNFNRAIDLEELKHALRHEYTHAVVAEISKYRCPAWLDEGLAQLFEGEPNPLLGPGLRQWISENPAMPLDWLQNGFTSLKSSIVPAAYAQSLFATRTIVNQLGFGSITNYLRNLGEGLDENEAFNQSFKRDKVSFEAELTSQIALWAQSGQQDP